jgi:hypothetical protein
MRVGRRISISFFGVNLPDEATLAEISFVSVVVEKSNNH